jgi:NAD-specific glutamate dehydrogenase
VTAQVLAAGAEGTIADLVARWKEANRSTVERVGRLLTELRAMTTTDAAMLSVVLRELRNLT